MQCKLATHVGQLLWQHTVPGKRSSTVHIAGSRGRKLRYKKVKQRDLLWVGKPFKISCSSKPDLNCNRTANCRNEVLHAGIRNPTAYKYSNNIRQCCYSAHPRGFK